ncbi:guanosine polyphosphate pyrophosphohydrolase/synthetase [Candidatus Symbiobacter mobilis CR]|uniref:Guanosine polyphosphate pyrophosphohydrolase/synthetase n=1 Tax=Candidatus Symbiobacter mobilis CR TaxID=946483 RepID=U5NE95_9BURK|nr:guanosine polyphosphate pyrophosphohydrolase/synthetase [Candidatus Symbiobacter mobilis CR]
MQWLAVFDLVQEEPMRVHAARSTWGTPSSYSGVMLYSIPSIAKYHNGFPPDQVKKGCSMHTAVTTDNAESAPNAGIALILQAALFAAERHQNQRRKDANASPYINHPLALASVLAVEGAVVDAEVLCAALLHDTIEDTDTTVEELRSLFGDKIAGIVGEVTDDKSLAKPVRKEEQVRHAPHISAKAQLVKLADKICNLRDLHSSPPAHWSIERKRAYFDWAVRVVAGLRGVHPGLEALFDQVCAKRP